MQAARGASLNPSDRDESRPRQVTRRRALTVFAVIGLLAWLADLGTKVLAVARLAPGERVDVVGTWFSFYLSRNPGAAFSTGTSYTMLLTVVATVAAVVVSWLMRRVRSTGWAVAFGFLIGGVLGNLTDRIFREPGPLRGHVVDFLMLPHWPVFNVADMCINVAAGLIILQATRGIRLDGTRER